MGIPASHPTTKGIAAQATGVGVYPEHSRRVTSPRSQRTTINASLWAFHCNP